MLDEVHQLERAEVLAPGERITRTATAAIAMYTSPWWASVPHVGAYNGCAVQTLTAATPDGTIRIGYSEQQCNECEGEIPWR